MGDVKLQFQSPIMTAEPISDLLEHTSIEFVTEYMQDKLIYVVATEVVVVGVPGNLNMWIEISAVPSLNTVYFPLPLVASALGWGAIGGGGGAIPPIAPVIEAPTGVHLTIHNLSLPWTIHSNYARLVVQTPVAAAPATAFWNVTAIYAAKAL